VVKGLANLEHFVYSPVPSLMPSLSSFWRLLKTFLFQQQLHG